MIVEYIPTDKIGEVIGPKGKIIREITEETGADIDIDEAGGRGVVHIYSNDSAKAQMALERIRAIANPVVPKEGERYYGTVVKTADFGAFVSLSPGQDGLLHISKLGGKRRLSHADEAVSVGDKLWVEVREVRPGGKYSLDIVADPAGSAGDDAPAEPEAAPGPEADDDVDDTGPIPLPAPVAAPTPGRRRRPTKSWCPPCPRRGPLPRSRRAHAHPCAVGRRRRPQRERGRPAPPAHLMASRAGAARRHPTSRSPRAWS